jgi:SAM-dependent methyltransferase
MPNPHIQQLLRPRPPNAVVTAPAFDEKGRLAADFHGWLSSSTKYALSLESDGLFRLDYLKSVEKSNQIGNNSVAQDFNQTWATRLNYHAVGRFLAELPRCESGHLRVLDIGCGPGHYLKAFHALGFESIGIDVSDEMVAIAKQTVAGSRTESLADPVPPPRVEKRSLFDLAFEAGSFDGIWYSSVVVHVPRRLLPGNLAQLRRILKDRGVIFISALLGSGSVIRREGRVFFYYGAEELGHLFDEAGFTVVSQWSDEVDMSSRGGRRKKQWLNYLLRKES